MGRSRANFHAEEDPTQRSRRKKNASSGESFDYIAAGQGAVDGKPASYHCNYCNKDITGRVRIKCAMCSDFDLCIECFSVGVEVHPHKSNHPYRVMDILSFPLLCPDWNADEEMLLLEGIEMYGIGKWAEVCEHVGTKTKYACIEHYTNTYLNSPYFPLPDMTHVVGRNIKELLDMTKENIEDMKGFASPGEITQKDGFVPRVKVEDANRSGSAGHFTSASNAGIRKPSNVLAKDQTDSVKLEGDIVSVVNLGSKKPKPPKDQGTWLMNISGYNPKRHEFDPEYDNEAEQLLADMEFKENDTEEERELKLRVLRIYSKRLDERQRRKKFIIERNLLYPTELEKTLSHEEKDIWRHYDVFMRFHSKQEHEELLEALISEHRILKKIKELKEARAAGCRSSAEADRYIERKRKMEAEENVPKKETYHAGPRSQESMCALGTHPNKRSNSLANVIPIVDLEGAAVHSAIELLSEPEKQLCRDIRLPPPHYLNMLEMMTVHIFSGNITKKSDAYTFFQIETTKVDRVYDMLLKKGVAPL